MQASAIAKRQARRRGPEQMKSLVTAALIATLVVAGCGTRLNPLNWFGSDEETIAGAPDSFTSDPRDLVAEVTSLRIERVVGGAIIHATGLPPTQGYWDAELVPVNDEEPDENRRLVYEFRVFPPIIDRPPSTTQSREIVVAHYISDRTYQDARGISVVGAGNTRTSSRR